LNLIDKVALITGGSRGIGKAVAEAFVREGAHIVIASRTTSEIESTIQEMKIKYSDCSIVGKTADVSDATAVKNLVDEIIDQHGAVDVLVNAAGVQPPIGPFAEVEAQEWIKSVGINLFGSVLCCRSVLPRMISRKAGKIINFSGGGATGPRPYFSAYACGKTAVVRFTETLAEEVRGFGIDVNAVAPGAVNTKMLDEIIDAGRRAGNKEWEDAERRKDAGGTPPEAAAHLVAFLASDESNGITGKLISAPWDLWRDEEFRNRLRADRDLGTLRRIDNMNFCARTK
jgi:3-oxoacyl-[acyl-carrier protein] reductase